MPTDKIQQSFIQQQLHNETVKQNIQNIYQLAEQQNSQQLIQSLHQWSKTPPVLSVTNTLFWTLIGVAFVVGILCILIGMPIWALILPNGILIFAFIKKENNKSRDELFDFLKLKILEEKYNIQFGATLPQYSISDLQQAFPLFSRGNHENYLSKVASGFFRIDQQDHPFTLFQYHYVDEITHRDQDGKVTYRYQHHDQYGVFLDNMPVQGISISNDQKKACALGTTWTTSDIQFNKQYAMSGETEMALARFFSPSRVLLLDKILDKTKFDLYFHPHRPLLCWQFNKNIFQTEPKQPSLHSIHHLAEYLEKLHMPEVDQVYEKLISLLEKVN